MISIIILALCLSGPIGIAIEGIWLANHSPMKVTEQVNGEQKKE